MKVLVSGASGLIGKRLVSDLEKHGDTVVRLVRGEAHGHDVPWNPAEALDPAVFDGIGAMIHLAGENIAGRWTEEKKKRMYDSRVQGTSNLARAMAQAKHRPQVLVSASGVGVYGSRGDQVLDEGSPPGNDFLARMARDWEAATESAVQAGIRTVIVRMGVVLAPEGGALPQMLGPFRMGLGGRVGSGRQWMSWIAVEDAVAIFRYALDTPGLHGPVNAVAPNPVTNAEFTRTLGRVLSRPALIPLPAAAVRTLFGEMGKTLLLGSSRVRPRRLEKSGYRFRQPELEAALHSVIGAGD